MDDKKTIEEFPRALQRYAIAVGAWGRYNKVRKNKKYTVAVVTTRDGNRYTVNGAQQSTLKLERGLVYTFDQTSGTNTMHPLQISTVSDGPHAGGPQYNKGWRDNGGRAGATLISTFTVPADAPARLYYYCSNHAGMGGKIEVRNTATNKAEPGSARDDADQSQPAAPDERRRGSGRNAPGSASTEGGAIRLSPATDRTLQSKLDAHHEKVGNDKTKRTTLRALQAVYRRGAGAFSVSHRPGMARAQWAMARVNHFLHLLETGKPKDPKYITDNDLLPEGHPAIVEKQDSFKPPKAVRDVAARGLELRREWGRGGMDVREAARIGVGSGVQRATNLKNGDNVTLDTIRRMVRFFQRHSTHFKPNKLKPDGGPTAGTIAYYLWGGTPGKEWANRIWDKHGEWKKQETPAHFGGGKNIEIFGYETKHFDICKSAVLLFERLIKDAASEKDAVESAAKYLDEFFGLEKKVVGEGESTTEDALQAMDLVSLFTYELGKVAKGADLDLTRSFAFITMHFYEIGRRMVPEESEEKHTS
tara:strand:+ start:3560 stop:5155 length:1596 start_codon:yes stop_codon:yes gene_type:complete